MTAIDYDTLVDACYDAGLDEDAIRADYSGRGMFGDGCLGIVYGSTGELLKFAAACVKHGIDTDFFDRAREDSMGRSAITYFPGVTVEGAPDNDEEDDDDDY